MTSEQVLKERVIRVFISSTFRDMQAERDYLVKFVFPQLKKLCYLRDVVWGEVDLRWGVTDEQKAEGKVLPICLEEITRCRPYFIGILGERYGWVPDEIPDDLIEKETWLKDHSDHSVTELEIMHGVLKNPEMTKHAFFYFRDPGASAKVEEELSKMTDYRPESETSQKKLTNLKAKIRLKGFPVTDNFPDPKALGEAVLRDMKEVINKLFPESERPDPLDREAAEHTAYAKSRSGVYIGHEEYYRRLDEYVTGESQPLVITGESGSGKSALLSNWALRIVKENPDKLVLLHFIGASPYSANWTIMLKRLMAELKKRFNIQLEIPDSIDDLRRGFAECLESVSARGGIILILDALNQLEDHGGALDLLWLPKVIPSKIKIILSTLPGRPLDEIKKRSWQTMTIEHLNGNERKVLIEEYLRQYAKSLQPDLSDLIASMEQTSNPLYLRALLEELRVSGNHEELFLRSTYYLLAFNVPDLYIKILARYEEDLESERPGLVRDVMTCLWAARKGLQESELLEILGTEGNPLSRANWTPLYLTAEQFFINRSGFINFSHDYFRMAVQDRYLSSEKAKAESHIRLAKYFYNKWEKTDYQESNYLDSLLKFIDEELWQYYKAGEWKTLANLLTIPDFLSSAWNSNEFDIKTYWAELENNSYNIIDTYKPVIDNPEKINNHNYIWSLADLLEYRGHKKEALKLRSSLIEIYHDSKNADLFQYSISMKASSLKDHGQSEEAFKLFKEQELICRENGIKSGLQSSLGKQADILYERGESAEALRLLKEQESICRKTENKGGLQASLGIQGVILSGLGEKDEAMKLYKEKENICREMGLKDDLTVSLFNQASIFHELKEQDKVIGLYKEIEDISRQLGNRDLLRRSLACQAGFFKDQGDPDKALGIYKEEERFCRETDNLQALCICLFNQSTILQKKGEFEESMKISLDHESVSKKLEDAGELAKSLIGQAVAANGQGRYDDSVAKAEEAYLHAIENGSTLIIHQIKQLLSGCLNNLAVDLQEKVTVTLKQGNLRQALNIASKIVTVRTKLAEADPENSDLQFDLMAVLIQCGDIMVDQSNLTGAEPYFNLGLDIIKRLHESKPDNTIWLKNLFIVYERLGNLFISENKFPEAENQFSKAADLRERFTKTDPTNIELRNDLFLLYSKIANIDNAIGRLAEAYVNLLQAHSIIQSLAESSTDNKIFHKNLAVSFWSLAELADKIPNESDNEWWMKTHHQFFSMKQRGILDPGDEKFLEYSKSMADKHQNPVK